MNNSYESIKSALLNPSAAAKAIFGEIMNEEMADFSARNIMKERAAAIIAAGNEASQKCAGYVAALSSANLSEAVCRDSIKMLWGNISKEAWDALYKAFIDGRGYSEGDLERFFKDLAMGRVG